MNPSPTLSASELINEGLRLRLQVGTESARPYFERAAQLEPNSHVPWFMLGNVASELGQLDLAVAHYTRARDLHPSDHVVRYNLGLNQLSRGYIDSAIEELRAACDLNPSYLQAQSGHIMAVHSSDRVDPEEIATVIRAWGKRFAMQHPAVTSAAISPGGDHAQRLRIGFISGDFRIHSIAHFFEPILNARDRQAFAYVLYSNFHTRDAVTERLRVSADDWRDVWQLTDEALIELIHADRIDILIDLSGHTAANRLALFAKRAAPIQVSYLGYPASTGLATMDYRITDAVTDPPELADDWHCERLLRLPDSQWCFRPFGTPRAPGSQPAREAGHVTFGSFNNLTKASDTVLRCWIEVLVKLPSAHLRMTRVRSAQRAAEIIALFGQSGITPERIEFLPYANDPPYGLQFAGVDIALDSYPYNGVTTTCESLYFGLPVISLYGRNGVSRSGLSLLRAIGLEELAASTPEQYVNTAVALGSDLARLEQMRASLRTRFEQSSLRDEKRFTAGFEELLLNVWKIHGDPRGDSS
ncbi:MAG TPA: tetratricopeptide repeat protein [Steroidobacteraceae bacterium]|jgi:predicted O-linked N-acetylglucosamine transferase (SPINDLY family)|nr:tetratricopeptide repeat protein [Steroidobacteraceae bacterium]